MTYEMKPRVVHDACFKLLAAMVIAVSGALFVTCVYGILHWTIVAYPLSAVVVAVLRNSRFDYIQYTQKVDWLMETIRILIPLLLLATFALAAKVRTTLSKRKNV